MSVNNRHDLRLRAVGESLTQTFKLEGYACVNAYAINFVSWRSFA